MSGKSLKLFNDIQALTSVTNHCCELPRSVGKYCCKKCKFKSHIIIKSEKITYLQKYK